MGRWRMRTGRPTAVLVVTSEEQAALERWARRPKTAQALAQRARIVLACATGATNTAVGKRIGGTPQKGGKGRGPPLGGPQHSPARERRPPGPPRRARGADAARQP